MRHHGAALRKLSRDSDVVRKVIDGWSNAPLSTADRELCRYAEKLTRTPWAMEASDVRRLTAVGLDERAVLDACQVIAYFNFVTRLADGLGVELEPYWDAPGGGT